MFNNRENKIEKFVQIKTIPQFHIGKFLESNFDLKYITIELLDRSTIRITDKNNDTMIFKYENKKVVYE